MIAVVLTIVLFFLLGLLSLILYLNSNPSVAEQQHKELEKASENASIEPQEPLDIWEEDVEEDIPEKEPKEMYQADYKTQVISYPNKYAEKSPAEIVREMEGVAEE